MEVPSITVREIYCTCSACPSQWEGQTDDGRYVYARYRHGHLRVGVGDSIMDAVRAEPIFEFDHGDQYDGVMTYDELKELLPAGINLPPSEANAYVEDPLSEEDPSPYPFGE